MFTCLVSANEFSFLCLKQIELVMFVSVICDFVSIKIYKNGQNISIYNISLHKSVYLFLSELERLSGLVGRPSESHPLHNSGLLSLDPVQDKTPLYSQLLQAYKWSNKVTADMLPANILTANMLTGNTGHVSSLGHWERTSITHNTPLIV